MVWYLSFHAQPVESEDNVYESSPFMLMIATKSKTDYKPLEYTGNSKKYQVVKPILVVCTDEYKMPMANGKCSSPCCISVMLGLPLRLPPRTV